MQLKSGIMAFSAIGLLFLGACGSSNQTTTTTNSPMASTPAAQPSTTTSPVAKSSGDHGGQGGQVIESGSYHLELVTAKESTGTHIDFFLQKGDNHEAIPNAKVTAQVQLPDGSQKSLPMTYDAGDKHYTAILPSAAAGEYKVAILSDISGEKVNGRFTFKQ
jgi:hypothetical protein